MIEELVWTSVSKISSRDIFESFELYPSDLNQPRKLLGYEDIFATIVRGKLFRVRLFEHLYVTSEDEEYPYQIIVDMADVYSNKSSAEFIFIKEYKCISSETANRIFNVICNNRDYFWIITDYLKRHDDKFDVNDDINLFEELHEFILSKVGVSI